MKKFYKMKLIPTEGGLSISENKYISLHETPCYHYCIPDWNMGMLKVSGEAGLSIYERAKVRNMKIHKIHKTSSRFAFETKELAYSNLLFLKKLQIIHMERDMKFLREFIKFNDESKYEDLDSNNGQLFVPNTNDLVNKHYLFD